MLCTQTLTHNAHERTLGLRTKRELGAGAGAGGNCGPFALATYSRMMRWMVAGGGAQSEWVPCGAICVRERGFSPLGRFGLVVKVRQFLRQSRVIPEIGEYRDVWMKIYIVYIPNYLFICIFCTLATQRN